MILFYRNNVVFCLAIEYKLIIMSACIQGALHNDGNNVEQMFTYPFGLLKSQTFDVKTEFTLHQCIVLELVIFLNSLYI